MSADLSEILQKLQEQEDVKCNSFIGDFMGRIGKMYLKQCELNIREFRRIAFEDLERIIRALEIYLNKFVDEILDITDKDILSGFIGADSTSVTVYCYDKGTEGELIANTIKLISEKRLSEKINNVPSKLDYVIQKKKVVF